MKSQGQSQSPGGLVSHGRVFTILLAGVVAGSAAACAPKPTVDTSSGGSKGSSAGGSPGGMGSGGRTGGGAGGSPVTTGAGGNPVTTGAGGNPVTTGAGGSPVTTGAGGAPAATHLCQTVTTPMNPSLIDFETYKGDVTADNFGAPFGGATPGTGSAYTGPYAYSDGTMTPTLAIMGGHPPGNYAVEESVKGTSGWGMGGGLWMGCTNASAYKGISFWVRGSAARGTFTLDLVTENVVPPNPDKPGEGGTCPGTKDTCIAAEKADIALTTDWNQITLMWSDFTPGSAAGTPVTLDGNLITGIGWKVVLVYQLDPTAPPDASGPYVPIPGDLTIDIDDVSFIP